MILNKLTFRARQTLFNLKKDSHSDFLGEVLIKEVVNRLLKDQKSIASLILKQLNISPSHFSQSVSFKALIKAAFKQAHLTKSRYVGTEHLLLGIIHTFKPALYETVRQKVNNLCHFPEELLWANVSVTSLTPTLDILGYEVNKHLPGADFNLPLADEYIDEIIRTLLKNSRTHALIVGERGVGKKRLLVGLAKRIQELRVPQALIGKRIIGVDMITLFESSISIIEELAFDRRILLYIEDLSVFSAFNTMSSNTPTRLSVILHALAKIKDLRILAATTPSEYEKLKEFDSFSAEQFTPIFIQPATVKDTMALITDSFKITQSNEVIELAVSLSDRYIEGGALPGKALEFIDDALCFEQLKIDKVPPKYIKLKKQNDNAKKRFKHAWEKQDLETAVLLRQKIKKLTRELEEFEFPKKDKTVKLTKQTLLKLAALKTGIPLQTLSKSESLRYNNLEKFLTKRVIGQDQAVRRVAAALKRGRVGISDPHRPLGSFLFMGPTGVGKTELARALAQFVHLNVKEMIKLDMSDFMERHSVSRLVGAPPGYVGYFEGGELSEAIRENPYSVVLFDEIEKAHPEVLNILLQIMEDGVLKDARGREADFRESIIILTSNIGAELIRRGELGFSQVEDNYSYEKMKERLLGELKKTLKPELINRLSATVVFRPLNIRDVKEIARLRLKELKMRLAEKQIAMKVSPSAVTLLAKLGYSEEYGARPLRRIIEERLETPLAEMVLMGKLNPGSVIKITAKDNKFCIKK